MDFQTEVVTAHSLLAGEEQNLAVCWITQSMQNTTHLIRQQIAMCQTEYLFNTQKKRLEPGWPKLPDPKSGTHVTWENVTHITWDKMNSSFVFLPIAVKEMEYKKKQIKEVYMENHWFQEVIRRGS